MLPISVYQPMPNVFARFSDGAWLGMPHCINGCYTADWIGEEGEGRREKGDWDGERQTVWPMLTNLRISNIAHD
ncbi:MAG: hypothetical protein K6T94_01820 [Paenibacillus sp.]|nr:hypothetical protein [Paenibacillus sp.]